MSTGSLTIFASLALVLGCAATLGQLEDDAGKQTETTEAQLAQLTAENAALKEKYMRARDQLFEERFDSGCEHPRAKCRGVSSTSSPPRETASLGEVAPTSMIQTDAAETNGFGETDAMQKARNRLGYTHLGNGHCYSNYIRGWDTGAQAFVKDTLADCIHQCNRETDCEYVSYNPGSTCSRYSSGTDCQYRPYGTTDHVSYKKGVPDFNKALLETNLGATGVSKCDEYWKSSSGPETIGAFAAADRMKDDTLFKEQGWSDAVNAASGRFVSQLTYGCSTISAPGSTTVKVCGCREFWCKLGTGQQFADASGTMRSDWWHLTGPCYSATQVFGCFMTDAGGVDQWRPHCHTSQTWKDWESQMWQAYSFP